MINEIEINVEKVRGRGPVVWTPDTRLKRLKKLLKEQDKLAEQIEGHRQALINWITR